MKFLSTCLLMLCASLAYAGTLEIINDANTNIFVSDHNQTAMLLMPGQSNTFESTQAHSVLYVYTETDKAQQFYTLAFQVVEKFQDHRKTTLLFNDIANNNLHLLYPNRFTVLTAEEIQKHKHHANMQTPVQPAQQSYAPSTPMQQTYQAPEMRTPTTGNDISPELVQSILAQIQRTQQAQHRTQQFSPYQGQQQTQPSSEHIVGHRQQQQAAQHRTSNNSKQHNHTATIPTSTQAAKQPSAHAGHHHHKHNHTHSSKSKRQRNLHRGSKFMSDNKK